MLDDLKTIPPLFVAVPDPANSPSTYKVSCQVSDDAKQLVVQAVSVQNETFCSSFGEDELTKVRNGADKSLSWSAFFKGIIQAVGTGTDVSLAQTSSGVSVSFKMNGCTATFSLVRTSDNGTMSILEKLMSYYQLRMDVKPEDKLNELQKKALNLSNKVTALEEEKRRLEESIHTYEQDEKRNMEHHEKLSRELNTLLAARGNDSNTEAEDHPIEPDFIAGIGRIPLGEKDRREFDETLLKLIKSKFTPSETESDENADAPIHCKVIRPFTRGELESRMKGLLTPERKYVMDIMQRIDEWDFNVFTIQDVTQRGALFVVGYALFQRYNFMQKFNLDEDVVINFLSQIEAGYHPNPYHNSMHAADVTHILHYILSPGGLIQQAQLSDEDQFAALIAGMIHDYDHPGINNNFHVKVQSYLAILYNDRSILENHHCAEVFELCKHQRFNIFQSLSEEQRRDVRDTITEMVLSTDMGLHAKIMGTWKRRIAKDTELHLKKDDQRLALSMAIKMADVSNCGRPESIYLKWTTKLFEEFFLQGDIERNLQNPVSPFMDRFTPSMAKSQVAFMNFIIIPMFESISEYLGDMHFTVDNCESNKAYWVDNDDTE